MASVCLLEESLTQLIDPARGPPSGLLTFTEKRESAFTLLRPEIPGAKIKPAASIHRRRRAHVKREYACEFHPVYNKYLASSTAATDRHKWHRYFLNF